MDIGIALPHHGKFASPEAIARVAREAEQQGYASIWVLERILRPLKPLPDPVGRLVPMPESYAIVYDPIETLTYAAAVTSRIKLGTSVIDVLFHPPVVLARRLATLDRLSGGRVIAGLGQGRSIEEFIATNIPRSRRGRGLEEYVAALRATWGPDPVTFEGRFYHIPESQIGPKPVHRGGIPVFLGGSAPAAVERAARIADGFNPLAVEWPAFEQTLGTFRNAAKAAGRDPDSVIVRASSVVSDKVTPDTRLLSGPFEKLRDDLKRLESLRVSHVFFDFNAGEMPVDDQLRLLDKLRKRLG